jgi:TPR repeat protein
MTRQQKDDLFQRADDAWNAGKLKSAFRLLLASAKAGDIGAQINLGTFYADGIGIKPNRAKALYWYRRAYRRQHGAAAHNIGILYRDEGNFNEAIQWLKRAVKLQDGDANLDIAKILMSRGDRRAEAYLNRVLRTRNGLVTEASREEAEKLLKL